MAENTPPPPIFWQTQYQFQTEEGSPLIRFTNGGILHLSADVEILPAAMALPELPWMVLFGLYLIIGMNNDASAAGAAGCIISS
jgi:hypothetical protein